MPTAILLAGPNGAGKTTFASSILRVADQSPAFLNADEIARGLSGDLGAAERDLQAGRVLIQRLEQVVAERRDFILETTLSSRLYARRIPGWRAAGYRVELFYVRLPSAQASLGRVRQRASRGGHDVPEVDVLRRYDRSVGNFETVYKPAVDEWQVWEGRDGGFVRTDRSGS